MSIPSIKYTSPEIAKDWDYEKNLGIDINSIFRTSRLLVYWKCIYGHSYQTSVFSRYRSKINKRLYLSKCYGYG